MEDGLKYIHDLVLELNLSPENENELQSMLVHCIPVGEIFSRAMELKS